MEKIPQELIDAIPNKLEESRESCQAMVDAIVPVCRAMGEIESREWPMFGYSDWSKEEALRYMNGHEHPGGPSHVGWIEWFVTTVTSYNECIDNQQDMEVADIASYRQEYVDLSWHLCNCVGRALAAEAGASIYRHLIFPA